MINKYIDINIYSIINNNRQAVPQTIKPKTITGSLFSPASFWTLLMLKARHYDVFFTIYHYFLSMNQSIFSSII